MSGDKKLLLPEPLLHEQPAGGDNKLHTTIQYTTFQFNTIQYTTRLNLNYNLNNQRVTEERGAMESRVSAVSASGAHLEDFETFKQYNHHHL